MYKNLFRDLCQLANRYPAMIREKGTGDSPILILVLFVNARHQRCCRRQDLIDEDEDCFLGAELDALADHINELTHGEVSWDKILLLVDRRDVRTICFLTYDLRGP